MSSVVDAAPSDRVASGPGVATRARGLLYPTFGVTLSLLAWELAAVASPLSDTSLPRMSGTAARLFELIADAGFWTSILTTLRTWAVAYVATIVLAVSVGLLLSYFPLLRHALRIPIEFLRPVPPVTLLPLGLLIFGVTIRMQLLLIIYGALWPLLIHVVAGLRETDPIVEDTASVFRFSHYQHVLLVKIPSALPTIATGIRVSASIALLVTITTELIGGAPGIGLNVYRAQVAAQYETLYALVFITAVIGLIVNSAFARLESLFIHWHAPDTDS